MNAPDYVQRILDRLQEVKQAGKEWKARCPAHDDRQASLSVGVGDKGGPVLKCFAGCDNSSILAALNLTWSEVLPPDPDTRAQKSKRREVAAYHYTDAAGKLLYEAVRFDPKGFSQRRPGPYGYVWNLDGVEKVLYRLPDVLKAKEGCETIYLVEGEKDVDRLRKWGLMATCNAGGAGKWLPDYTETLRGAHVVLLPDNDDPGRKHRDMIGAALLGVAASVRVLDLPGLPEKGDVSDWIQAGGTKEEFQRLAAGALLWEQYKAEGEKWQDIVPFGIHSLPAFPTEALPEWLRSYVEALAKTTQTPPDMAACIGLSIGALCLAKIVEVNCGPSWIEPSNLFIAIFMPPASRKTIVVSKMAEPVEAVEEERTAAGKEEIARAQTEFDILKGRLAKQKQDAATEKIQQNRQEAEEKALHLAQEVAAFQMPAPCRLLIDDCTPERLAGLLSEQGGRIGVISPEGDFMDLIAGRYSEGEARLGVYLKSHAGDTLRVDRTGDRRTEYVAKPALTLGLAVQPEVLRGIARKEGLRGRGLFGRFLYSLPASNIGFRSLDAPELPDSVSALYNQWIRYLLKLTPAVNSDGKPVPYRLCLNPSADGAFRRFRMCIEERLRPGEDLGDMPDWAGKLCGAVARIAGILHVAEHGLMSEDGSLHQAISENSMCSAIQIGCYFIEHAKAAYQEMGADVDSDNAQYVLDWIKRKQERTFKKAAAHRALQGRFKRVSDIETPLDILAERGYIRLQHEEPDKKGAWGAGRPSTIYEVNPALFQ